MTRRAAALGSAMTSAAGMRNVGIPCPSSASSRAVGSERDLSRVERESVDLDGEAPRHDEIHPADAVERHLLHEGHAEGEEFLGEIRLGSRPVDPSEDDGRNALGTGCIEESLPVGQREVSEMNRRLVGRSDLEPRLACRDLRQRPMHRNPPRRLVGSCTDGDVGPMHLERNAVPVGGQFTG